ncbi:MAG: hypothetical protein NT031_11310 [Planctomycetota bacterium]|nr:hypothetical protein [Planctomycetota bacterium]
MTAATNPRQPFQTRRQAVLRVAGAFLPALALLAMAGCYRERQMVYYAPAPAPAPAYANAQPAAPAWQDQPAPEPVAYYDQGQYAQPAAVYAQPTVITQQVPVYIPQPVPVYVQNTIVRDRVIVNDRDARDRRTNDDRRETNWNRYTPAPVTHGPIPAPRKPEPVKTNVRMWNDDRRITTAPPTTVTRKLEPIKTDVGTLNKDRHVTASSTKVAKALETTRPAPRASEKVNVKALRDKAPAQVAADTDRLDKKDRNRH